jgi:Asp-tRNA(Asn)/Glu-tRNA(Gln) amidotransferase A subunit family amidase
MPSDSEPAAPEPAAPEPAAPEPAAPEPAAPEPAAEPAGPEPIPPEPLRTALDVVGLNFAEAELALMGPRVAKHREGYGRIRAIPVQWELAPAVHFEPRILGLVGRPGRVRAGEVTLPEARRPESPDELAFASIPALAALVRSRAVSCVELATLALDRLARVDSLLHCVVTLTRDRALTQARALDKELARGKWRGPLHGIPWGAKDLLAVRGYPTTWGTPPFADQALDLDATVVERLDAAGAVLVAKLSLGELAWGDVWTGGRTNNPWDLSEGASGSSAGSAAAVAAGAVAFAIGSETLGSIISPAQVCGVTGLRPTFGRVSRHGAMALAWSMDKLGPMCRSAEDAAIVFDAIAGPDGHDETVVSEPLSFPASVDPRGWRIGVVEAAFEKHTPLRDALDELRSFGCELVPIELPKALVEDYWLILDSEAATSFDDITRDGRIRQMVRDEDEAWPNVFRSARLIPAVDYLRANRVRRRLMLDLDAAMRDLDLLVHPSDEDATLAVENLAGQPAIALPWGSRPNGAPDSIALAAHLDREMDLLGFAIAWQSRTDHHKRHPVI